MNVLDFLALHGLGMLASGWVALVVAVAAAWALAEYDSRR